MSEEETDHRLKIHRNAKAAEGPLSLIDRNQNSCNLQIEEELMAIIKQFSFLLLAVISANFFVVFFTENEVLVLFAAFAVICSYVIAYAVRRSALVEGRALGALDERKRHWGKPLELDKLEQKRYLVLQSFFDEALKKILLVVSTYDKEQTGWVYHLVVFEPDKGWFIFGVESSTRTLEKIV